MMLDKEYRGRAATALTALSISWILLTTAANSVITSQNFFSLSRTALPYCNVVTFTPASWIARNARTSVLRRRSTSASTTASTTGGLPDSRITTGTQIREIIYLPNVFELYEDDTSNSILEDDHFCSLLVDRGFTVHVVSPHRPTTQYYTEAIAEVVSTRTQRTPGSSICLIGSELTVPRVLNYLSDVALPMTPYRVNIGAAILIEPPPVNAMISKTMKIDILKRYTDPMKSSKEFRRLVAPHLSEPQAELLWQSYTRRIQRLGAAGNTLLQLAATAETAAGAGTRTAQDELLIRPAIEQGGSWDSDTTGTVAKTLFSSQSASSSATAAAGMTTTSSSSSSSSSSSTFSSSSSKNEVEKEVEEIVVREYPRPPPPLLGDVEKLVLQEELLMIERDLFYDEIDPAAKRRRQLQIDLVKLRKDLQQKQKRDVINAHMEGTTGPTAAAAPAAVVTSERDGDDDVQSGTMEIDELVGKRPSRSWEVAAAMKDRILVISSFQDTEPENACDLYNEQDCNDYIPGRQENPKASASAGKGIVGGDDDDAGVTSSSRSGSRYDHTTSSYCAEVHEEGEEIEEEEHEDDSLLLVAEYLQKQPEDDWSYAAAAEVAEMYKAGPVIHLRGRHQLLSEHPSILDDDGDDDNDSYSSDSNDAEEEGAGQQSISATMNSSITTDPPASSTASTSSTTREFISTAAHSKKRSPGSSLNKTPKKNDEEEEEHHFSSEPSGSSRRHSSSSTTAATVGYGNSIPTIVPDTVSTAATSTASEGGGENFSDGGYNKERGKAGRKRRALERAAHATAAASTASHKLNSSIDIDENNKSRGKERQGLRIIDTTILPPEIPIDDSLVWTDTVRERHKELARIITDWLDMLTVFGYI